MALAPWKIRVTADGAGTLDAVHATIELVDRAANLCPNPWAWFHPDDRTGATGDLITYHADRSGNGRHLAVTDTGVVRIRIVDGERLLYSPAGFVAFGDQLSGGHDGVHPLDLGSPPSLLSGTAWTFWAVVVDPTSSDTWFGMWPQSGEGSQGQMGTDFFGKLFGFDQSVGNLFSPSAMPSGRSTVAMRWDTVTDQAELLLDGTVVDTATGLGAGWALWGVALAGATSDTGGLGEVIMWDQWVGDECLP